MAQVFPYSARRRSPSPPPPSSPSHSSLTNLVGPNPLPSFPYIHPSLLSTEAKEFDVYLSFRDEDTRSNFTNHLYAALRQRDIKAFRGDTSREHANSKSLLDVIRQSKISIIIFSEDYASSQWCLEELVKIFECRKSFHGQIVIPVFYHINPSDVRNQTGAFGDGFAALEQRSGESIDTMQKWRETLTEASNLSGWYIDDTELESQIQNIEEIVKEVLWRLNPRPSRKLENLRATPKVKKYDIYLSFRGEDTQSSFTSHLYRSLYQKKIKTFFNRGIIGEIEEIPSSLLNAIEESKISIVIFSVNYAYSLWCLEELVKIVECKKIFKQDVIPIFYHIDPSHVRKQTGTFGDAFAKHETNFDKLGNVHRWRSALKEAANVSGWYVDGSHGAGLESLNIKDIVKDVSQRLNCILEKKILTDFSHPFASSSHWLNTPEVQQYDVYLSFRVEDTRYSFTSHLYAALCRKKIKTFIDGELCRGDEISPSILKAIEESKISVIVFSEGYVSSSRCLDELAQIYICKNMCQQIVVPVFYNVDPLNVRKQNRFDWIRNALHGVFNLSGFHVKDRCESDSIEEIVEFILKKLNYTNPSDNKDMVGVQSSIEVIESSLHIGLKDVCVVGIWRLSGVGKTTIAKVIFDRAQSQFEDSYFALNIREESEGPNGLTNLRQELLLGILKDQQYLNRGFTFIHQKLAHKKVFIVFDDVTSFQQIEILVGDLIYLGLGSRIIITTTDRELFRNHAINFIYEVKPLSHRDALQVFCWCAFQQSYPTSGYDDLSNVIVKYALGIPLALKVLGTYLRGKRKRVWLSAMNRLERTPHQSIQEVLKVSYDGLDNDEKKIFMDIACFLRWENKDFATRFLDVSGFFAEIGISALIDKCLITISRNKKIMHGLLQEMGREIVQQESYEDIGERSRLWHYVDISHVLRKNAGTKAIEGICLDMSKIRVIHLNPYAFARMHNLRFLKLYNSHYEDDNINKVLISQLLETSLTKLRYLCWHGCPLKSLQSNFHPENLLVLDLSHSKVEKLWTNVQHFGNLKHINLSHSKNLLVMPDLSLAPNMESLVLEGCTNLVDISSSFEHLNELVILNLRNCRSLKSLPSSICELKSLEHLILSGCSELDRLPDNLGKLEALKVLEADMLAIRELPSSIVYLRSLMKLSLINCCIIELPHNLSQLSSLENLLLGGNDFKGFPASIIHLSKLSCLNLGHCEMLQSLPELPCSLEFIDAHDCTSLESPSRLSILSATNRRSVGVNFSNCFKMDQDAIKSIMKDALQEISHTTAELHPRPCASICFPGTEIPEWFSFQNSGSSITLKLPSGWFNPNFLSFAICAVVGFRNYHDEGHGLVVGCECKLRTDNDMVVLYRSILRGWCDDIESRYVDSDHIFLGYDLNMFCYDFDCWEYSWNDEVQIQLYVEDLNAKRIDCCKVIKCGVFLLYSEET